MTAPTYRAVLVANSTFPADPYNLPDLEGPRNDPALLRDALCDRDVGLFAPDNVRLVTERTMSEVLSEADDLLVSATRRDTLLIYYSGHGLLDQSGELFLCTRDTRSDRLRSTAVKASDLRGMMDASAAGTMVVVLDCCHSGRFKGSHIPATLSGRGRFVVTSSRPGELANDADVRNHASLFTHHLAEGIVRGAVDHDGDGIVTLSELYDYVRTALADEGRQVPQKRFEGDGDVALARRSAVRVPADLVDPTASAPILDLSETAIHLGEVGSDEHLPPERIAVINRGGGTLDWTAESSARWVEAVAEGNAVALHLHPEPGPNRANVYVREAGGALKTIRISVRVREPAGHGTEPPVAEPVVAAVPGTEPAVAEPVVAAVPGTEPPVAEPVRVAASVEPPVREPAPAAPGERQSVESAGDRSVEGRDGSAPGGAGASRWSDPRWWGAAIALLSLFAGIALVASALDLVDKYKSAHGEDILLRSKGHAGPVLPEVTSGIALAAVGVVSLAMLGLRRLSPLAAVRGMVCCFAIAVPWSLFLLGDAAAMRHADDGWMMDEVDAAAVTGWLVLLAGLAAVGLARADAWRRGSWSPRRIERGLPVLGLLWVVSLGVDYYTFYDEAYGSLLDTGSPVADIWFLLAGLSIVALIVAGLRFLAPDAGSWLVVAAAATPLALLIAELLYVLDGDENPDSSGRLLLMAVPALALFGLAVAAPALSRREAAGDRPGGDTRGARLTRIAAWRPGSRHA